MSQRAPLTFVEVLNPFEPANRSVTLREFQDKPLSEWLGLGARAHEVVASINGKVVPDEELALTRPQPGDCVVVCPIPHGGGGGDDKSILRIVALIVVTWATAGTGSSAAGAMMGTDAVGFAATYGAVGVGLANAAVTIAGGMMVNALLPPPKAPERTESSPTYGADGAKNTSAEGVVVPVTYGKFRFGGNIANNYVVNDGDSQWLYMLLCCGEGPVGLPTTSSVRINEQPISAYKDIEVVFRQGTQDQEPIPWFNESLVPQSVGHKLTQVFHQFTTSGEVDRLRFDFMAPAGMQYIGAGGDQQKTGVPIVLEYSPTGQNAWQPIKGSAGVSSYDWVVEGFWFEVYLNTESGGVTQEKREIQPSDVLVGDTYFDINGRAVGTRRLRANYSDGFVMWGNQTSPLRQSFMSEALPEAVYDVRVRRTNQEVTGQVDGGEDSLFNQVFWTDLVEITNEKVAYRNSALMGLKIRLTDQLNGVPTVTHETIGKIIRVWNVAENKWDSAASGNPAWVSLDILTNKRYGGGAPLSRFNIERWKEWAAYCDANNLEFNGVFDTQTNVWDAVQIVFRCGHAQLVRAGTRYEVAIERPDVPVQMFSVANMISGSFKETWLPVSDRINEVEVRFADETNDFKERTLRVVDADAMQAGQSQRSTTVDLRGVTNATQAWKDAWIMLNMNREIKRSIQFAAPIEAISSTIGDVITVQHDMPQWGFAGRTDSGSTTTQVVLDREVTMVYGKFYGLQVRLDTVQRHSGTVSSVGGLSDSSSIVISGYNGATNVKRAVVNGKDVAVRSFFQSGANYGVITDLVTGVSAGQTITLWDTDVLETHPVVNPAPAAGSATVTAVTVSSPFSKAPDIYVPWMFGEVNKIGKPFRIKAISGSHEYRRDITAVEYNGTVYDPNGVVPTPNYSAITSAVSHVTIDAIEEQVRTYGLTYKSVVTVRFSSAQETFRRGRVYVSRNGAAFEFVGEDERAISVEASKGDALLFKVVAVDVFGKGAADSTAPTQLFTVAGKTEAPNAVEDLSFSFTDAGILFKWTEPGETDWTATKARVGATWESGEQIFNAKATSFVWAFQPQGTYNVLFRHFVQGDLPSATVSPAVVQIQNPLTPTISSVVVDGKVAVVSFSNARTTQPLRHYIVKLGSTASDWNSAVEVQRVLPSATTVAINVTVPGVKRVYLAAVDMGGNTSPIATNEFTVVDDGTSVDPTPPPALAGLAVTPGLATNFVTWTVPDYTEGGGPAAVNLYAALWAAGATRPVFADAAHIASEDPRARPWAHNAGTSKRYVYWAKSMTVAGVEQTAASPDALGVESTTSMIAGTDLGPAIIEAGHLADGSVTAESMALEAIDATKFARGIEPIVIVPTLPTGLFQRSTVATYIDAGLVQNAVVNEPRFQNGTLLLEGAATNLLVRSAELDNASWSKTDLTVTANATTAPDGTTTADKLVESTTASTSHILRQLGLTVTAGTPYVYSHFVKAAGRTKVLLYINATTTTANRVQMLVDLTTGALSSAGAFGTFTGYQGGAVALSNGWYRVWVSGISDVTSVQTRLYTNNGSTITYTGDGTSGVYAWGGQFELGTAPSSYIPTVSATASRTADVDGYVRPRIVMLATDYKLYRLAYPGGWQASVPSTDVTGQLTDSQLAAIAAAKVSGQLTDAQLAAISASKVSGQLTDAQLAAISSTKIAGQLTDAQIAAIATTKLTGQITDAQVAAVAAAKLTGTIGSTQIAAGAITTPKLAAGAVTANEIAANTITTNEIAANAVTTGKLAAGAVTTAQLAAGAVTANEIAAGAVTTIKLAAGSVTATQIAADTITAAQIAASAITATELAAGAVTTAKLAANAVTANEIAAGAITTTKLAAGAVTANEIAANTITAAKIAAGTITATELATGSVTTAKLAAGAVTANEIAANTITAGKIAAGAISATEIAAGAITASKLLIADSTNILPDEQFQDAGWAATSLWSFAAPTDSTFPSARIAKYIGPSIALGAGVTFIGDRQTPTNLFVPVTPGDLLLFSAYMQSEGGANGTATIYVRWYDASKTFISENTGANPTLPVAAATRYTQSLTVPSTARYAGLRIRRGGTASTTVAGWVDYGAIRLTRKAAGELIVDGAITATKLAANSIAVGTAAIQNGAIVNAMIGTAAIDDAKIANLDAAKITAGTISAARIGATSITGDKIAGNTITGDKVVAGAITAQHIAIAPKSLNTDPDFSAGAARHVTFIRRLIRTNAAVPASCPRDYAAEFNARDGYDNIRVPVQPGEQYKVTAYIARGTFSGDLYGLFITYFDSSGSLITYSIPQLSAASGWQFANTTVTIPAGTTSMGVSSWMNQAQGGPQTIWITDLNYEKVNDASLIVDGTITTSKISAGAVTADKLTVGGLSAGNSISPDPNFMDSSLWEGNHGGFPAFDGLGRIHTNGTTNGKGVWLKRMIPVNTGKRYVVSVEIYRSPGADGSGYLRLYTGNNPNDGKSPYWEAAGGVVPAQDVWTTYSGVWTATTDWCTPMVLMGNAASSTANWYARNLRLTEIVGSVHIDNGAITADKIQALTITADQIKATTISADKFVPNVGTASADTTFAQTSFGLTNGVGNGLVTVMPTFNKETTGSKLRASFEGRLILTSKSGGFGGPPAGNYQTEIALTFRVNYPGGSKAKTFFSRAYLGYWDAAQTMYIPLNLSLLTGAVTGTGNCSLEISASYIGVMDRLSLTFVNALSLAAVDGYCDIVELKI